MSKESWSARIEAKLKKEIQEFTKNSDYTNEDLVKAGFNILKNPQEDTMQTNSHTHINQKLFNKENFDINNFEEINISNLSRVELQNKLISISFFKSYDTLFQMQSDRHFYIRSIDTKIDNIFFQILEDELELEITLDELIKKLKK